MIKIFVLHILHKTKQVLIYVTFSANLCDNFLCSSLLATVHKRKAFFLMIPCSVTELSKQVLH